MKAQRPSGKDVRTLPASLKYGETGETWGNLKVAEGEVPIDQRFVFEGDAEKRLFQVTRDFPDPLDASRHILFYEAVWRPDPVHQG